MPEPGNFTPPPPSPPPPYDGRTPGPAPVEVPDSWHEALFKLIGARLALIRIEGAEAGSGVARRLAAAAIACVLALFLWALFLAGGIGLLAHLTSWNWFWIALAAGGLHAAVILRLAMIVRKPSPAAFPITRAELEKDLEWIETLKKKQNSNG
jgi:hypothetical protein